MSKQHRPYTTEQAVAVALDTAVVETRIAAAKRASAFGATNAPILDLAGLKAIADVRERAVRWLELERTDKAAIAMEALSEKNIDYTKEDIDDYIERADERTAVHVAPVVITLDQLDLVIDQVRMEQAGTRWASRYEDAYAVVAEVVFQCRPFWMAHDGGLWVESDDRPGQWYRTTGGACSCHAGTLRHAPPCWHRAAYQILVRARYQATITKTA